MFLVYQAASKGNLEEFQRLYESDIGRINIRDAKGNTPIHKAAEAGRVKILEFIHEKGGGNIYYNKFMKAKSPLFPKCKPLPCWNRK